MRYRLEERLGGGAMATVHRARDTVLGVDRAVKVLHPSLASVGNVRERFLAEGRALARVQHPHVLRLFDVGETDAGPFLVMELARGSLQQRLDAGALPVAEALDVVFQLLTGLEAVHRRGIVHRDVKPGNVLLGDDGRWRLADFGIAHLDDERRTRTGVSMGSAGYAAPEQREDAKTAGIPADVYGAGALLFALVDGRAPPEALLADVLDQRLADVPEAVRKVVARATAWRPETRYRSAREMAEAVAKARDAVGPGTPSAAWMARFDESLGTSSVSFSGSGDVPPTVDDRALGPVGAGGLPGPGPVGAGGLAGPASVVVGVVLLVAVLAVLLVVLSALW